jgi:hypothetical protein
VITRLWSWLWLVECNNYLLNTELALLAISMMAINGLGNEAYITASGLHGAWRCFDV